MSSKRFKKLPKNTNTLKAEPINNLLSKVKGNCTTKFDESLDINILINNKQKKNEINLRSMVNLPSGTGKKVKVAVVCEESKLKEAKDSSNFVVQFCFKTGINLSTVSASKSLLFFGNLLNLFEDIILLPQYP